MSVSLMKVASSRLESAYFWFIFGDQRIANLTFV
tara:strand:- start:92 stop:193 length:102 start_codon:yes stop_codon:yes gene_type:complete